MKVSIPALFATGCCGLWVCISIALALGLGIPLALSGNESAQNKPPSPPLSTTASLIELQCAEFDVQFKKGVELNTSLWGGGLFYDENGPVSINGTYRLIRPRNREGLVYMRSERGVGGSYFLQLSLGVPRIDFTLDQIRNFIQRDPYYNGSLALAEEDLREGYFGPSLEEIGLIATCTSRDTTAPSEGFNASRAYEARQAARYIGPGYCGDEATRAKDHFLDGWSTYELSSTTECADYCLHTTWYIQNEPMSCTGFITIPAAYDNVDFFPHYCTYYLKYPFSVSKPYNATGGGGGRDGGRPAAAQWSELEWNEISCYSMTA